MKNFCDYLPSKSKLPKVFRANVILVTSWFSVTVLDDTANNITLYLLTLFTTVRQHYINFAETVEQDQPANMCNLILLYALFCSINNFCQPN